MPKDKQESSGARNPEEPEFNPHQFDHIRDAEKPITLDQFVSVLIGDVGEYRGGMAGAGKHSFTKWMESFGRWLSL